MSNFEKYINIVLKAGYYLFLIIFPLMTALMIYTTVKTIIDRDVVSAVVCGVFSILSINTSIVILWYHFKMKDKK